MEFVSIRKMDELGRIILPVEIRRLYGIGVGDTLGIEATSYDIILSKECTSAEFTQYVDELGRITLPDEYRAQFNFKHKEELAVIPREDGIHLRLAAESDYMPVITEKKPSNNAETYIQDYTVNRKQKDKIMSDYYSEGDELLKRIRDAGVYAEIGKRFLELPHIIIPERKAAYDKALEILDVWAMVHCGKIHGEVSYEEFDAKIIVTFPFFEFIGDNIETLQFLSATARSIVFEATPFGDIKMMARFEYFEDIGDKNKIVEEVMSEHTDLVDALYSHRNNEKEVMLADLEVNTLLSEAAEMLGVTPEEYIDCLDFLLREDQEEILGMLHQQFKQQQDETKFDEM